MIKFFKLIGGEEIVAEVDDAAGEWCERIEMRRPHRNLITQQGAMLVPYPCAAVEVATAHVLFSGEANEDLQAGYRQATSGIVTPPKHIQLPGGRQ